MTTEIITRTRVELERDDPVEMVSALLRVLGQIDRGARIIAIEVESAKPVRIGRQATTPPLPPSSSSSHKER